MRKMHFVGIGIVAIVLIVRVMCVNNTTQAAETFYPPARWNADNGGEITPFYSMKITKDNDRVVIDCGDGETTAFWWDITTNHVMGGGPTCQKGNDGRIIVTLSVISDLDKISATIPEVSNDGREEHPVTITGVAAYKTFIAMQNGN